MGILLISAAIKLLISVTVFSLLVAAAWGLGDWILAFIEKEAKVFSRLSRVLISVNLGLGVIGQFVFIAGLIGDAYQPKFIWPSLIILAFLGIMRFKIKNPVSVLETGSQEFSKKELFIIALTVISLVIWLYAAISFTRGSDVISHHYQHVKECIKLGHFGHVVTLPSGYDQGSNYNPTLVHMHYLIGKILSDDRAANLIHWLSQVMLLMAIYVISRDFISRHVAVMAIAIYLGFSLLFNFPTDVNDYTALTVFMLISLYLIFLYNKTRVMGILLLAGVFAGLMLSTKYYGIPLMMALCLPLTFWNSRGIQDRLKEVFIFCTVALIIYSPWVIYNLKEFGDPLYPSLSNIEYMKYWAAFGRENTLFPFIAPTDHGYFWPNIFYFLSMFIPFEPGFRVSGLTPIFLIGLPASFYYLIRMRGEQWKTVNMLFIMSLVAFIAIEVSGGPFLFYKFGIFAGVLYAISLSSIFISWQRDKRQWIWTAVIVVATLNTFFAIKHISAQLQYPPLWHQEYLWNPLEKYLNGNLEKGAVVANHDIHTNYYLRPDIHGLPSHETSTDWDKEEAMIRSAHVQYYVFRVNEEMGNASYFEKMINVLDRLSAHERAASTRKLLELYGERTRRQELFLQKFGHVVKELPGEIKIYRLLDQS